MYATQKNTEMNKTRLYVIGSVIFATLFVVIPFGWLVKFKYEQRLIIRTEEYGPLISAQVGVCSKPEWVNALRLQETCAGNSGVIKMSPEKMAAYDVACTFFPCSFIDNNIETFLDKVLEYCSVKTWNIVTVIGALYIVSVMFGFVVKVHSQQQRDHTYYPPNVTGMPMYSPYAQMYEKPQESIAYPNSNGTLGTTIFQFNRKQKSQ